jgi:quinol monooxygenase YgiN
MIHVIATVELVPGKKDQFLAALRDNLPHVLAEDGCVEYTPTADVSSSIGIQVPVRPDVVTIVERWRDMPALQAHLAAPHMIAYRVRVKEFVSRVSLQLLEPV